MVTFRGILMVILILVICFSLGALFIGGGSFLVDEKGELTQAGQISVGAGIVIILLGIAIVVFLLIISHV